MDIEDIEIIRETKSEVGLIRKFTLLKNAYRSQEVTKAHLRKFALNRLELEKDERLGHKGRTDWMNAELQLAEALSLHEINLKAYLAEFENVSPEQLKSLSPSQRLEFKHIQKSLEKTTRQPAKTSKVQTAPKTAFEQGRTHGHSDGFQNKARHYRPKLLKAIISEVYRRDYIRGYNEGYREGRFEVRRAELQRSKVQSRQVSRDLER